jgi:hypothetical protein
MRQLKLVSVTELIIKDGFSELKIKELQHVGEDGLEQHNCCI